MSYVVDFEDLPTQELNFLWETVLLCVCVFYCVSFSLSLVTDENAHCFEEEEEVPLFRERVQISASGHADADQSGADFFRFRFQSVPILSVPIETESAPFKILHRAN